MERWRIEMERARRRYEASPSGKATVAMYAAAKKAGFESELSKWHVECEVEGKTGYVFYEHELREREGMEEGAPRELMERAEAWLARYLAK